MMIELLKKSLRLFFILQIFSCSISAPIIREHEWDITLVRNLEQDLTYETLSIFVNCYDEDGANDINTIFFIDDKDGIYWELTTDSWDYKYIDGIRWIGSSNIIMPDRSPIPRTPIRVYIRDLAGESVEDKLYISKKSINPSDVKFPELIIEDNKYSISGYDSGHLLLIVDFAIVAEGEISSIPSSFESIFDSATREDFDENAKFNIVVNNGDLTIRSGPWYLQPN